MGIFLTWRFDIEDGAHVGIRVQVTTSCRGDNMLLPVQSGLAQQPQRAWPRVGTAIPTQPQALTCS